VKKFCDDTRNEADDNGPKDAHINLRAKSVINGASSPEL
jgi:hypothetical protein